MVHLKLVKRANFVCPFYHNGKKEKEYKPQIGFYLINPTFSGLRKCLEHSRDSKISPVL